MKNTKFIIAILFFLTVNILAAGLWYYSFAIMTEKNDEFIEIRKKIKLDENKAEDAAAFKQAAAAAMPDKNIIDSVFLNNQETVKFVESMETMAAAAGVELKISKLEDSSGAEQKGGGIQQIKDASGNVLKRASLELQEIVTGSFKNVFAFLTMLENSPFVVVVKDLSLEEIEAQKWQAVIGAKANNFLIIQEPKSK